VCPTFGALALDPARVASRPTQSRPTNRRVKIDVIPFPGAWTPTESPKKQEVPNPSDAIARSATDMSEGVESRIRGSRKISDIFSTAYEDTASPLAETAQGLGELTGFWIAWGATDFTHGPGIDEPLIAYTQGTSGTRAPPAKFFFLHDAQNSVREVLTPTGETVKTYDYKAYGKRILLPSGHDPTETPPSDIYGYTSREHDDEIGLIFYRARYYDPIGGNFLQSENVFKSLDQPKTHHKYTYTEGNPINSVDPFGQLTLIEKLVVSAIVVSVAAYGFKLLLKAIYKSKLDLLNAKASQMLRNINSALTGNISASKKTTLEGLETSVTTFRTNLQKIIEEGKDKDWTWLRQNFSTNDEAYELIKSSVPQDLQADL